MNSGIKQTINHFDILNCLPHRYPFLLIDKVQDYGIAEGNEWATGFKNVSFSEPCFQGHFPNNPVFPGVLIIEALAQISGIAILANSVSNIALNPVANFLSDSASNEKKINNIYFIKIDKATFRKKVLPGDVIFLKSSKVRKMLNMYIFESEAFVEDKLVASANLTATFD